MLLGAFAVVKSVVERWWCLPLSAFWGLFGGLFNEWRGKGFAHCLWDFGMVFYVAGDLGFCEMYGAWKI